MKIGNKKKEETEAFILVWFMESGSNMPKFEKSLDGPQECHFGLGLLNQIMKPGYIKPKKRFEMLTGFLQICF